ncbi:MAG TPA: hypothetical protein PKX90_09055, partial [bacterium]|nr:hypothetical protein [bacterium]
ALDVGKEITVKPVPEEDIFVPERESTQTTEIISTGIAREFLPHGTIFNKTVTVKIPYTDLDLDTNADGVPDLNENDLRAYYWDGIRWVEQNCMVDTVNKVVIWYTNHFSIVGIFAGSSMSITNTKTVYMTRNPLKPGNPYTSQENEGTIFKIDYNAFDVELFTVNIYDLNGRLKATLSNNSNEVPWTGLNNGGEYIGSGLYVYKARVQLKNGEIIEKFGKLGIIK